MKDYADHGKAAHIIAGSPYEQMRRIMARHLCGWISGHSAAEVDHFLGDADLIMREAHEHGIRFHVVDAQRGINPADGFVDLQIQP